MVTGPAISTTATPFSAPQESYTALPGPVTTYPMGVPVPRHPHIASTAPSITVASVPIAQIIPGAPALAAPHAMPVVQAPAMMAPLPLMNGVPPPSIPLLQGAQPHHRSSASGHHSGGHVATTSTSQVPPVEYCGDFRTTGHCRFGSRCRYSHDVEPRVKTSKNASTAIYRPSITSTAIPASPIDPLPPVPPGYNLSNVFPQPHHIPGVPLAQQPHSPFVYAPSSSVAHPLTAPAATAAADRGVVMSDKDKATKILKSLGLNPQQVLPHRPAPVVMADGEIRYDLTRRRSTNPEESHRSPLRPKAPSRVNSVEVVREAQDTRNSTPVGMMSPRETLPVMGSSAGMVMEGDMECREEGRSVPLAPPTARGNSRTSST